jgi:5-methylthioribose kinase
MSNLDLDVLISEKHRLGGSSDEWTIDEIGDGNVNLIFRVRGPKGQVLIKQAVPYLRCVGESWPLSMKRNFFEYTAFKEHAAVAREYLPEIYSFNEKSASIAMEFLDDHIILRKGMIEGRKYPKFAEHITDYMAKTLFFTSDLYLSAEQKKLKMKVFCDNTDLCKITEDLIFTDPYRRSEQNRWTTPQLDDVLARFQKDTRLKMAATEMKAKFLTSAEALIHGDLHSGSIMANETSTKVIDPEFAFYGPMGFDVGLLLGNLMMSYFSQPGWGERGTYESWVLSQIEEIWTLFSEKFSKLWDEQLKGDYLSPKLVAEDKSGTLLHDVRTKYIEHLFTDSLRFGACEMIRRIFGLAHVADLDTIPNLDQRATCEFHSLTAAYELLVNHTRFTKLGEVTAMLKETRKLPLS